MLAAKGSPDEAAAGGIEGQPVSGVAPAIGNAIRGAAPGLAAVGALKEAYIGVVDEDVPGVEGVKLDAVVGGYIESAGGPCAVTELHRIRLLPGCAAIEGAISAEQVSGVSYGGVAGRDAEAVGRVEPDVVAILTGALLEPTGGQVGSRLGRFLKDDLPGATAVDCLGNAIEQVVFTLAELEAAETCVGDLGMVLAGGDGFKMAGSLLELGSDGVPVQT